MGTLATSSSPLEQASTRKRRSHAPLNFLADEPWDEVSDDVRARWFGHPFGADVLGASLRELLPGSAGGPVAHAFGVEEMFFVLTGTPTVRTPEGEGRLSPGDVVYFPEGPAGLHDFSNPTDEPARLLAVSSKRFPDVVAYPERGAHGWQLAIPNVRCLKAATTESSLALTYLPRAPSTLVADHELAVGRKVL